MNLDQLIINCQKERQNYRQSDRLQSPACVQIFRLAFSGNQDAWTGLYDTFKSQIKQWIGSQSKLDPEDILQDAWLSFAQYAPHSKSLTDTDSLGPVLTYLRRCVKSTLIDKIRALKKEPDSFALLDEIGDPIAPDDPTSEIDIAIVLKERLDKMTKDKKEKLVLHLRFVCNMPPREIFTQYVDKFESYQEVATIIQRLTRRLRQDPILQGLQIGR